MTPIIPITLLITSNWGGIVDKYLNDAAMRQIAGEEVRIDGTCASACTIYLGIACVTPSSRLLFHAPSGGTDAQNRHAASKMAEAMPPDLGRWYLSHGMVTTGYVELTGAEAIGLGVKQCQP